MLPHNQLISWAEEITQQFRACAAFELTYNKADVKLQLVRRDKKRSGCIEKQGSQPRIYNGCISDVYASDIYASNFKKIKNLKALEDIKG